MSDALVIVVGDVMLDVAVRPTWPLNSTSDTPARVRVGRGGAGANVAVALALAGLDVTYVGAAGRDLAGRVFAEELASSRVRGELESVDAPTGVVVALVSDDGQRSMMTDRGANRLLTLGHVMAQLAQPFGHLHVSGYTLLDEATRAIGVAALRRANELDRTTSVDVCSVAPLRQVASAVFLDAAAGAATLFANEEEAMALSGASDAGAASVALARSFSEVVVTLGPRGALARRGATHFAAPSKSDDVLDTTGAGDAATGAYLAARLRHASMDEALDEAMRAAAAVVRGLGSRG